MISSGIKAANMAVVFFVVGYLIVILFCFFMCYEKRIFKEQFVMPYRPSVVTEQTINVSFFFFYFVCFSYLSI